MNERHCEEREISERKAEREKDREAVSGELGEDVTRVAKGKNRM